MSTVSTIGVQPARLDVMVWAGSPVDFTVPVLDDTGAPVSSLAGYTAAAEVAPPGLSTTAFVAVIDGVGVRVTASPTTTRAWGAAWAEPSAPWDLVLTGPDGVPLPPLVSGWVQLRIPTSRED